MLHREERSSDGWSGHEVETHSQRYLCKSGGLLLGDHCQSPLGLALCLCLERPGKNSGCCFLRHHLFVSVPEHQRDSHLGDSLCVPDFKSTANLYMQKMSILNLHDLNINNLKKNF